MSLARWASLLDDENLDDTMCAAELEDLKAIHQRLQIGHGNSDRSMFSRAQSEATELDNDCGPGSSQVKATARGLTADGTEFTDSGVDSASHSPLRDLSTHAVWSVSTAKPGNGVDQLLDGSDDTYWQSDGPQPHCISAQFSSKFKVSEVRLFLSYEQDESYTPSIVSVRVGSSFHDLRVINRNKELIKPQGWVTISLSDVALQDSESDTDELPSDEDDPDVLTSGELVEREHRRRVRAERRRHRAKIAAAKVAKAAKTATTIHAAMERQSARDEEGPSDLGPIDPAVTRAAETHADSASTFDKQQRQGTLQSIDAVDLSTIIDLRESRRDKSFVRAHMLQIIIHCNHQNGRDSHVRQVKVLGPAQQIAGNSSQFSSRLFKMYETIR
jgi:hypothetical protein